MLCLCVFYEYTLDYNNSINLLKLYTHHMVFFSEAICILYTIRTCIYINHILKVNEDDFYCLFILLHRFFIIQINNLFPIK